MRFIVTLLVVVAAANLGAAQEKSWTGKTILVKKAGIVLTYTDDDGKTVEAGTLTNVSYRVLKDQDGFINVNDGRGNTGWFKKADAVLLEDAVDYFTDHIRDNPKNASAYNSRAEAWSLKGDLDIAIKDMDDAVRLNPIAAHYSNRGTIWSAKKDHGKAIADYNEAIRLDPKYVLAYNNRGNAWSVKKDFDKAIADYNEAIRLDSKYVFSYYNRGNAWRHKKDYDKAIADYNEAIRLDPKDFWAFVGRSHTLNYQNKCDKAIDDCNEAIRLNPKIVDPYKIRGFAWFLKKEYEKAIQDLEASEKLDRNKGWVYHYRAKMMSTCAEAKYRDGKKAVELAKKALDIEKNPEPEFYETLASAYAESGDFVEAVRWQEKALGDPSLKNDKDARRRLELYKKKQPYRQE